MQFLRYLLTTLKTLTGDVSRHAKTVLIRQKGNDKMVLMWNENKLFFRL